MTEMSLASGVVGDDVTIKSHAEATKDFQDENTTSDSDGETITNDVAERMIEEGNIHHLSQNLGRGQKLSSKVAQILSVRGYRHEVNHNLHAFDIVRFDT